MLREGELGFSGQSWMLTGLIASITMCNAVQNYNSLSSCTPSSLEYTEQGAALTDTSFLDTTGLDHY